jgi:hypothetical protein
MRAFVSAQPVRDLVFVASSGHELSHLGLDAFVERRPTIVADSVGWIHLGANIGAAVSVMAQGTTIQASDDEFEALLATAMAAADLRIGRHNPRGTIPGGEAEVVHRGGGRYLSVIGSNALFHNPSDRGPEVVNAGEIGRFVRAFTDVAHQLILQATKATR